MKSIKSMLNLIPGWQGSWKWYKHIFSNIVFFLFFFTFNTSRAGFLFFVGKLSTTKWRWQSRKQQNPIPVEMFWHMTCNRFVVYCGYSTNKTDCHVITEILLKVAYYIIRTSHSISSINNFPYRFYLNKIWKVSSQC
jgi:hypothetical protein